MQKPLSAPRPSFGQVFLFEASLGLLALVLAPLLNTPLATGEESLAPLTLGIAAALPLVAGLILADRLSLGPLKPLQRLVRRWVLPLFRDYQVWQLLLVSLAAGIGEELLFRGLLQPWLARLTNSPVAGLAIASLLFGAAHALSKSYFVLASGIGFYFGWLATASHSLLAPIAAHATYDFAALVYLLWTHAELADDNA